MKGGIPFMKNILLVFTGGTICSCPSNENQKNQSNAKDMSSYLEQDYKKSNSPFKDDVYFIPRFLRQDILSENMTIDSLNELLDIFRNQSLINNCVGAIILHGTDTMAYTSSLLSLALAGLDIPICMVSAQLDLKQPKTNGYINFRASVELIMNGIAPNVYVVYRNLKNKNHDHGDLLVHYGSHLLQCSNHSNNFHSYDEMTVLDLSNAKLEGKAFETNSRYIDKFKKLTDKVMLIEPYTNLRYSNIILEDTCSVVHGTYHSESVCIGRAKTPDTDKNRNLELCEVIEADRPYSILTLVENCRRKNIPLFLAPCDEKNFTYGTTANALFNGALAIPNTTLELAYAKVILGCSLGKKDSELIKFLNESINHEFIYREHYPEK